MLHFENQDEIYFLEKADQLFRLIKHARASSISQEELCVELDSLANEFMTRAVEVQTKRDRGANAPQK